MKVNIIKVRVTKLTKNKYKSQQRWQEKNNLIAKTYKLNRNIVEQFKEACEKNGVTQASKLTELMQNFINESNKLEF